MFFKLLFDNKNKDIFFEFFPNVNLVTQTVTRLKAVIMSSAAAPSLEAEEDAREGIPPADLKIILLGDSAVGKSKLVERFLLDNYHPRQRSTYALTLYRHHALVDDSEGGGGVAVAGAGADAASPRRKVAIDFWDTAGQERFASLHASYYSRADACVLVFDVTRKVTYTNLVAWYEELRKFRPHIPCICIANKIDVDYAVTSKAFAFPTKEKLPFFFVSAADGTNVVAIFEEAIRLAWLQKTRGEKDFMEQVLDLIDDVRIRGSGRVLPRQARPQKSKKRATGTLAVTYPPPLPPRKHLGPLDAHSTDPPVRVRLAPTRHRLLGREDYNNNKINKVWGVWTLLGCSGSGLG